MYQVNGEKVTQCNIRDITERKRADKALRESDTRFRTLFENAADIILYLEIVPDGIPIIREANRAILPVLGYQREEVIGRPVSFLAAEPDGVRKTMEQTRNAVVGEANAFEVKHRCKNGAVREFECSGTEMRIDGKRFAVTIERDVTDRRRKDAALAESEERHRQLFQASAAVKLLLDPESGAIVDANQAACDFYGYSGDQLRRMKIYEINQMPPDESRRNLQLVKDKQRVFFNFPHRLASGEIRQVEIYSSPIVIGGKTYLQSIVHDVTDRKLAEEQLRESEARYRLLADNSQDIIWTVDMKLRPTYISPSVLRVRGLTAEEAMRQTVDQMVTPDGLRTLLAAFAEEFAVEGQPGVDPSRTRRYELEEYCKDGSTIWTETVFSFLRDEEGRATGILGITRDIAERKRAEEALLKNEKRLSNAMEMAHLAPWDYDVTRDLFTFNDLFYGLFRTTADQVGGYTMSSAEYAGRFVHPDDAALVGTEIRTAIETTEPNFNGQLEHRVLFGDGAVGHIAVRFFIVKDTQGRTIKTYGVNQDITERKRAEEALRESEERFRTVTENIGTGVAMISPDMKILALNRQMREWFPDVDAAKKHICYRAFNNPPGEFPCVYCPTLKTLKDGQRHEATTETPTPQGTRHYRVVSSPVLDKDGTVRAAIEMVEDITDQMHAGEEKAKLEEQLRQSQKMETVGRLAGGVAHDFNNLLQVINTFAELSLGKLMAEDPLHKNLKIILEAGERAADLTRQLLAFSRKQVLQTEILDINQAIAGMEKMLRRMIGEDIDLVTSCAADLGKVKADPGQIEQVLMNLAANSRDAMPMGGKLTIETANVELDRQYAARHAAVTPGPYVMLAVADTGDGMDEKTKASIFEPFFTTKEKGKGTGLGLSTVYGIVKQSGGYIWVYSELGKGTTFKIYLPRDTSGTAPESPAKPAPKTVSGTETILVVEDEENVRRLAEQVLKSAGFMVIACANAGEALLVCEQHKGPIHLMLTDVVMPQMGGKQLAERLSAIRPEIKVLFMSGYTDNAIVHHGVLEKGTQFISKPFTIAALTRKVRETLDREGDTGDGSNTDRG